MKEVRWGIIGCGDVTEVKSGPALQKASGSRLIAVMRRDGSLARDYAERHNVGKWYTDAEKLIADPEINAVYVATPPSSHLEYTLLAARAGKPVYVEKPMALNHDECRRMIAACKDAGVPLFVAYYRRALERFEKIREIVHSGELGKIRFVNITFYQKSRIGASSENELPWRVLPEISGGGLFVDLASHMLDFLDHLFGPISAAEGRAANQGGAYPAEDLVASHFQFESGVQGTGLWCFTAFEDLDRTEIVGSRGIITYSTFDDSPLVIKTSEGVEELKIGYPEHIQQPLIQSGVDSLLGRGKCPSTGVSGARTSWVMDRMLANYR